MTPKIIKEIPFSELSYYISTKNKLINIFRWFNLKIRQYVFNLVCPNEIKRVLRKIKWLEKELLKNEFTSLRIEWNSPWSSTWDVVFNLQQFNKEKRSK